MKTFLIIGIAGGLARITAHFLKKKYPEARIIGVDSRSIPNDLNQSFEVIRMPYTRNRFEKLFRENKIDCIYHLARMSHTIHSLEKRLDQNLTNTQIILDLALQTNVKKIIIMSTFHVYGAFPDNPVFINEDHPLRASIKFPELRDVVEMDQICSTWMWRHQNKIDTVIFRPCNVIGPNINNTLSRYLISPYVPICMDFNPMFQFVFEQDMADILVRATDEIKIGVYNVASDDVMSIKKAKERLGSPALPIPSIMMSGFTNFFNSSLTGIPKYFINYIKYATIIDNSLLKKALGDKLNLTSMPDSLDQLKLGIPN